MSHTDRLKRSAGTFRQLTGITPAAFDRLLADLEPRYAAADARRKNRPARKRKLGAGRKHALPLADRLLMLLMYYRTYTTHAFLGFLFGVDDSAVGRNINPLQPLLAGIFRIPERKVTLDPEDLRELFFDATERPIPRPTRGQKRFYSGKKKRHTLKHQVVVTRRRKRPGRTARPRRVRIAAISGAFPGRTHDKKVYDRTRVLAPPGVKRTGDTAYLGTGLGTPTRRPPKGTLTARQKAGNRRVSRRRIVVEHGIGKMKVWRIAAERFRNPRRRHTLIMKNVAGLHNLMFA
jgi:DDE superfamily endonuclease/Helix-turn-helix of DDE superfamily endonuclease